MSVLKANTKLVQKGECWTWNQRSRGSILTGVAFCYWKFCFHVIKPLMPILAPLQIYGVSKNFYWGQELLLWPSKWCVITSQHVHEFNGRQLRQINLISVFLLDC